MFNLIDTDLNLDLYREQYKNTFKNDTCFIDFADQLEKDLIEQNIYYKIYLKDKIRFSYF
jgi:hypothetical protein